MHTNHNPNASSQENGLGTSQSLPTHNPSPEGYSAIEFSIAQERLRQARRSFDLAWFTTAACAFVGIGGVMLMMAGQPITGGTATAGGLGATVYCLRLAKDANDRLDKLRDDD